MKPLLEPTHRPEAMAARVLVVALLLLIAALSSAEAACLADRLPQAHSAIAAR